MGALKVLGMGRLVWWFVGAVQLGIANRVSAGDSESLTACWKELQLRREQPVCNCNCPSCVKPPEAKPCPEPPVPPSEDVVKNKS